MAWLKINKKNMYLILKHCHLNGSLDECILKIKKGIAQISAIDTTNTLAVFIRKVSLGDKNATANLGIGNLEILLKYLNTIKDKKLKAKIDDSSITLNRADQRRSMKYILSDTSLIATTVETEKKQTEDDVLKTLLDLPTHKFPLTSQFAKDYLSFVGITKIKTTQIVFNGHAVSVICGAETDHKFTLTVDEDIKGKKGKKGFKININGEFLARIFNTIEEAPEAVAMIGADSPLVIEQGNTTWVLTPMEDE